MTVGIHLHFIVIIALLFLCCSRQDLHVIYLSFLANLFSLMLLTQTGYKARLKREMFCEEPRPKKEYIQHQDKRVMAEEEARDIDYNTSVLNQGRSRDKRGHTQYNADHFKYLFDSEFSEPAWWDLERDNYY